jgi:RNA polymerase primary sigma factor
LVLICHCPWDVPARTGKTGRRSIERPYDLGSEELQTLEAVGRRLKLSRERIRQIEERAKQKLRLMARTRHLKDYLN